MASASSVRGRHRRGHRRKRGQRQARRPPDKHSSGSDASNEGRKGALGFNKDFPYINAKAACIKCGDGWMPGYWHRRARVHFVATRRLSTRWPTKSCATTAATSTRSARTIFRSTSPTSRRLRSSAFGRSLGPTTSTRPRQLLSASKNMCGEIQEGAAEHARVLPSSAGRRIRSRHPVERPCVRCTGRCALCSRDVGRRGARACQGFGKYNYEHTQACAECCPSSTKSCAMLMQSARTVSAPSRTGPIMCMCRRLVLDIFRWPTLCHVWLHVQHMGAHRGNCEADQASSELAIVASWLSRRVQILRVQRHGERDWTQADLSVMTD